MKKIINSIAGMLDSVVLPQTDNSFAAANQRNLKTSDMEALGADFANVAGDLRRAFHAVKSEMNERKIQTP